MGIASNTNLAIQHRDAIRNAVSGLEGALEASVSVTNTDVSGNIQNVVTASNNSADGIRTAMETDADNILQIGETFCVFDFNMGLRMGEL